MDTASHPGVNNSLIFCLGDGKWAPGLTYKHLYLLSVSIYTGDLIVNADSPDRGYWGQTEALKETGLNHWTDSSRTGFYLYFLSCCIATFSYLPKVPRQRQCSRTFLFYIISRFLPQESTSAALHLLSRMGHKGGGTISLCVLLFRHEGGKQANQ